MFSIVHTSRPETSFSIFCILASMFAKDLWRTSLLSGDSILERTSTLCPVNSVWSTRLSITRNLDSISFSCSLIIFNCIFATAAAPATLTNIPVNVTMSLISIEPSMIYIFHNIPAIKTIKAPAEPIRIISRRLILSIVSFHLSAQTAS